MAGKFVTANFYSPICFDKLKEEDGLVYCKYSCGNNVHESCFKQWRDTKSDVGQEVTPMGITCIFIIVGEVHIL
jgi:hypothetical protein